MPHGYLNLVPSLLLNDTTNYHEGGHIVCLSIILLMFGIIGFTMTANITILTLQLRMIDYISFLYVLFPVLFFSFF